MSISPIEVAAGIGIAREVVQFTGDVGQSLFRNLFQQQQAPATNGTSEANSQVNSQEPLRPTTAPRSIVELSQSRRAIGRLLNQFQAELARTLRAQDLPQGGELRIGMNEDGQLSVKQGDTPSGEIQQAIRQSPLLTDLFRAIRMQAQETNQQHAPNNTGALELLATKGQIHVLAGA